MKKLFSLLAMIGVMTACAPDREIVQVVNGINGSNGHSLVSQFVSVESESIECNAGGSRLDIYLDLDDSLSVSEGDQYSGSLVACNGSNGLNGQDGATGQQGPQGIAGPQGEAGAQGIAGPTGPAGPQGPQGATGAQGPSGSGASITAYNSNSCTAIAGSSYYVKGNYVYSSSNCSSSSKVSDLNGNDATFWVSSSALATGNNGSGVRVIEFN